LASGGGTDFYPWQALYDLGFNNAGEPGILQASVTAADLLWESNNTFDLGVDFAFAKRFHGTVEYFNRESANLLFRVPMSLTTGLEDRNMNTGTMYNRGIEFHIAGELYRTKDFSWSVDLNISTFQNRFKDLPFDEQIVGTKKYMVGRSINDFWLREWVGVDSETGEGLYRAAEYNPDNSRIVGADTLTTNHNNARFHYAGTSLPDFFGGISNTVTYKNFTLSALLSFSVGGQIYDGIYAGLMSADPDGGAAHVDILNRWQQSGDVTDVPRLDNINSQFTNVASDRWLVDASYLNFRSVNLSYMLPPSILSKVNAKGGYVYVSGENLGWVSARRGMFVSQNFSGTTSNVFTPARTITLGLNINL
jgi:hypothetical protein